MKSFFIGNKEVQIPIIQGGMGVGISLSGLASAVANEGGIGVISCAGIGLLYKRTPADYLKDSIWGLREELRKVREKTNGIVGVNIMVALTNFADMVRTSIEEKADIIFSGAGLPLDLPSYLKPDSKTLLVPIVSSARAAKLICNKWQANYNYLPDAIVVEGPKAGGHLGYKREQIEDSNYTLEQIVPEVLEVVSQYASDKKIPIIAGGGISNGEEMLKFINLGASAVQLGSLFVPTYECDASVKFKNVYIDSSIGDLSIIQSPVGMPGRAFGGEFMKSAIKGEQKPKGCPYHCIKTCDYANSPYCIMKALFNAAKGNMNKGYAFAGANAFLADKMSSVKEVIQRLKYEIELAQIKFDALLLQAVK